MLTCLSADFVDIAYKLKSKPFPQNKQPLTANPLKLPDSITVSDFPSHTQEFILDMYFKRFGEVIHVNMQPEWNRAVVKFDSHESKLVANDFITRLAL